MNKFEDALKTLLLDIGSPYQYGNDGWDYCAFCQVRTRNASNVNTYSPEQHRDDCAWMNAFQKVNEREPEIALKQWREQHIG